MTWIRTAEKFPKVSTLSIITNKKYWVIPYDRCLRNVPFPATFDGRVFTASEGSPDKYYKNEIEYWMPYIPDLPEN